MARTEYTTLSNLADDISEALHIYRSNVLAAIADHIDECARVYIENAKLPPEDGGSPFDENNHETAHYRDCWAVKSMKKAKYVRYIGNTKKVKAHRNDTKPTIPLINILEFSKRTGHPHVSGILKKSEGKIVDIIASNIKKEGK